MKRILCLLLIMGLAYSCSKDDDDTPNPAPDPKIDFEYSGNTVTTLSLSHLKSQLNSEDIALFDHVHQKDKNYRAFPLKDVLTYAFSTLLDSTASQSFQYKALDGFEVSSSFDQSMEAGGYLAFEDLDVSGSANWEPVALENNNDPYPYYIVWTGANQNPTTDGYPWPYQLKTVVLLD